MKFLDEAKMAGVRAALEAELLRWPGVTAKEMMGCLCYFRGKRFFAFLVTDGLVLTKLSPGDREQVAASVASKPFEMSGRTASSWLQVSVKTPGELLALIPYVRKSYEGASR